MKNKKMTYGVISVLGIAIVVIALASTGVFGENFQGMLIGKNRVTVTSPISKEVVKETTKPTPLPPPPNPEPTVNPTSEQCWEMYEYLVTHDAGSLSQWMSQQTPPYTSADAIYCSVNVIGATQWGSGNPSANQCEDIYNYWQQNTGDFTSWMINNGYPQGSATYCKLTYYPITWDYPSNQECNNMYSYLKQNGLVALSNWMITNNYTRSDSEYCASRIGQYWYYPTNLECTSMYNYLVANGVNALSVWMQSNNLSADDSEYCADTSNPQNWFNPSTEQCEMLHDYLVAYGVAALSNWMQVINLTSDDSQYCSNLLGSSWYQ